MRGTLGVRRWMEMAGPGIWQQRQHKKSLQLALALVQSLLQDREKENKKGLLLASNPFCMCL